MNILCIINEDPDRYSNSPEDAFPEHTVTVIHSFGEGETEMINPDRGIPSFDIVLADCAIPWPEIDKQRHVNDHIALFMNARKSHTAGIGVFFFQTAPPSKDCIWDQDKCRVMILSHRFITTEGTRDWKGMLDLVLKKLVPQFEV